MHCLKIKNLILMKNFLKKIFNLFGFQIQRLHTLNFPIELSSSELDCYNYVRNNNLSMVNPQNLFSTLLSCRHVHLNSIPGDFVECGVWKGGNSILAKNYFQTYGESRNVWLYDTFTGMTKPTDVDISSIGEDANSIYSLYEKFDSNGWCHSPLTEVQNNFTAYNLSNSNVKFIVGDILQTTKINQNLPESISILRLDTDWYESTKCELEIFYPKLSIGGILIIDDYGHWSGAKKAVDEYFLKHKIPLALHYIDSSARIYFKISHL